MGFFGLCHFVGLMVFGLIPLKTNDPNISADNSDWKKKNSGNNADTHVSALISLGSEKSVGVNIFPLSALIFLALRAGSKIVRNVSGKLSIKRKKFIFFSFFKVLQSVWQLFLSPEFVISKELSLISPNACSVEKLLVFHLYLAEESSCFEDSNWFLLLQIYQSY